MTQSPPLQLKVKKLEPWAILPQRSDEMSSGWDIHIHEVFKVEGNVTFYRTGLAFEPPYDHYLLAYPRSSLSKTDYWLANSVGVLDVTYRGEVLIALRTYPPPFQPRALTLPGRYVQVVPQQFITSNFEIVESAELSATERGDKGFGSSGVK